jgi:hypothetical protein
VADPEHAPSATADTTSRYDVTMWVKKLNHLLAEKLPVERREWEDFLADAHALGFGDDWVAKQLREAYELLVRQAVSDGVVTGSEHEWLELARRQVGMGEAEALEVVRKVVEEAEAFFGKKVKGA